MRDATHHPDDGFDDVRARLSAEARAEAEEAERLAALQARRRRGLGDVARDLAARGDVVAVSVGDGSVRGSIVSAGPDRLTMSTRRGRVHVALGRIKSLRVVGPPEAAAVRACGDVGGALVAILRSLELAQAEVAITVPEPHRGRLVVVANDHVVLRERDGGEVVVPLAAIVTVEEPGATA